MKPVLTLNALLLLTGGLFAGTALADTLADTEADCRIENNDVTCRVLSEVKPTGTLKYPAGRTVRINIPNERSAWFWDAGGYYYPAQRARQVTVLDDKGRDVGKNCPLSVSLTHWVSEIPGYNYRWAGADTTSYMEGNDVTPSQFARRIWWAGALTRTGDIARCPPGTLTVRLTFIPDITHQTDGSISGSLPPVQADFRVLNTKHVSLRVPPVVGLSLSDRGAEGAGVIMLQRWGDVSMEVTRADDGGEPSLNSPSGTTTVPLEITLDTLSGRRNVAKGSTDNVIRWDGRPGENGYRLNIRTHGNVKQTLTGEPGTWRSTLRVTVNAL
ncbi:hypothetical protein QMA77_23975 [Pantoea ananatis]|uniref:hypothetical protein n=1 Tax=Pantoea ananas TaxID=553 RepID=UPI0024AC8F33|nr:hypothetical protein [Pantoea ananatis]MDI6539972.1 hypothetical protein [Pantoea ananatis]